MARRKICDVYFTRTGFRYFECNLEKGFILNGRTLKIKGVCVHEDCGLLGKAVPANVHRYKIKLLKEMGANGYQTSHYQQNVAILDACDEAELILNGKSLGRKKSKSIHILFGALTTKQEKLRQ